MISSEYTSRVFSEQWAAPLCYIRLQIVLRRPITIGSVLDLSFFHAARITLASTKFAPLR